MELPRWRLSRRDGCNHIVGDGIGHVLKPLALKPRLGLVVERFLSMCCSHGGGSGRLTEVAGVMMREPPLSWAAVAFDCAFLST
jgi:hypothetical protein